MRGRNSVQQLRTMSNCARGSAETCRGMSSVRLPIFNNIRRCFLSIMRRVFASVWSGAFLTPYSTWNLQTRFGLPPWPIRGAGQGIGGVALRSKVGAARLTIACKRPPIASARASLRLSAAPEAQRSGSSRQGCASYEVKVLCRQLPDSDGKHIRGVGR